MKLSPVTYSNVRCVICNNKLRNNAKGEYCSKCRGRNKWKELYEDLKRETDKRFKLYDITIKNLMETIRKYEPIDEEMER